VVGIYFIGFEISEPMREVKKLIHEIKIVKTGYAFVIDSAATRLSTPPWKEEHLEAKDGDGHEIIKEIVTLKSGVVEYPWINKKLGETHARQKIATLAYYKPWDWIIATSSYTEELYSELRGLRNVLLMLAVLCAFVVSLVAYLSIRKALAPVGSIADVMHRSAKVMPPATWMPAVRQDRRDRNPGPGHAGHVRESARAAARHLRGG
jgi:methyl-accepting chemotaxis protein